MRLLIPLLLILLSGCTSGTGPPPGGDSVASNDWLKWFDEPCCETLRSKPPDESTRIQDAGRSIATLYLTHDDDSVMFNLSAHDSVPPYMQFGIEYSAKSDGPIQFASGIYWYVGAPNATHHPSMTNVTAVGRADGVILDVPMHLLGDSEDENMFEPTMLLRGQEPPPGPYQYFDIVTSNESYCFAC